MAGRLRQLAGLRRPVEVTSIRDGLRSDRQPTRAGLADPDGRRRPRTRRALSAAAESHRLRLSGAGRYGRFWWLSIEGNHGMRVVLLDPIYG